MIFNKAVGTHFKVITGYDSTGSFLAVERGEVDGICGLAHSSILASVPHWESEQKINYIAQFSMKKNPQFPNVPLLLDIVKDAKFRDALRLILTMQEIGRPLLAPPGVPEDRLAVLRKAFVSTMKDAEFLTEARKVQLELELMEHEEIEKLLTEAFAAPKEVVALATSLMGR